MIPRTLEPEVMDTVEEAVDYDSMDHSTVNRVFVADLLRFVEPAAKPVDYSLSIIDLGTGTALIPIELLNSEHRFQSVLACDLSQEMLKIAGRHLKDHELNDVILPVYCDAKRLPVAEKSVGLVMSNSIVHHIPEPMDVFHEIRRVVADDGSIFIRDLMRPDSVQHLEQIVQTYAGGENEHQQKMFRESLHAALTVEEVQAMLDAAGFPQTWVTATSDRHWTIAGRWPELD
ncbi:MAG: methyltransferase domain-containing protein [Fuerstiella sp.]